MCGHCVWPSFCCPVMASFRWGPHHMDSLHVDTWQWPLGSMLVTCGPCHHCGHCSHCCCHYYHYYVVVVIAVVVYLPEVGGVILMHGGLLRHGTFLCHSGGCCRHCHQSVVCVVLIISGGVVVGFPMAICIIIMRCSGGHNTHRDQQDACWSGGGTVVHGLCFKLT